MSKVLAVVVTYNAIQWVERCLSSLEQSSLRPDVLVIDNASNDQTVNYIRDNFPEVEIVASEDNLGFGAANNIGLRRALGSSLIQIMPDFMGVDSLLKDCSDSTIAPYDYVYLLNQDAWVEHDTIETLVTAHNPEYGVLSPVQTAANGELDRNFARKCGKYLSLAKPDNSTPKISQAASIVTVPFAMAAHWLISTEAIRAVGAFSPAFKQYGEDDNYIDRLHFFGFKLGVVPSAYAVHDRAQRPDSKSRRIRLKCLASVVRLSNPSTPFALSAIIEPIRLIATALKNFSSVPVLYIPSLLRHYKELRLLRSRSRKRAAFLTLEY